VDGPRFVDLIEANEKAESDDICTRNPHPRLDHSLSVDTQVQRVVTFLGGTLGIVLVTLLTWVVLIVVR
jgi:hypothetical protein